jgi:hypothetical protein
VLLPGGDEDKSLETDLNLKRLNALTTKILKSGVRVLRGESIIMCGFLILDAVGMAVMTGINMNVPSVQNKIIIVGYLTGKLGMISRAVVNVDFIRKKNEI